LVAGDVMNGHEMNRATAMLENLGAPRYNGDEMTDTKIDADAGGSRASDSPRNMPHYVAVMHPFVVGDFRENQAIQYAWSHSDINRLYNYELGEWNGIRACRSNLVPFWIGNGAGPAVTPVGSGGTFPSGTYNVQVTGSDTQNQYESQLWNVVTGAVIAANGSFTITTPATAGYTYSIYVGTGNPPSNLGLSSAGPTSGPMQGQATQLPPNTLVTVTGLGAVQVPPAAPAAGVTVYPTYIFGRGAYGQVMLDEVKFTYLKDPDKSDPLNQLRVVGWKCYYGTLIQNQQFFMRIESTSAFSGTFG
jgi:hypothetical protein